MHQPISARENLHKRAEFLRRDHASLIRLADLNFARHATDDFLRARHTFAAGRVDVHGTVILNINLSTGLRDDPLDSLPAWSDEGTDLLRIDFYRLDPRCVFREFRPRLVQRAAHDIENFRTRFFGAFDCFRHDLVTDAREL